MKKVIIFIAKDGKGFNSKKDCLKHDKLIKEVNEIMGQLSKRPSTCKYSNGEGYIQHDPSFFKKVKNDLLKLINIHIKHDWIKRTLKGKIHGSWVARLLEDNDYPIFSYTWYRFLCTDSDSREWGQPYFSMREGKGIGKMIQLNKRIKTI